MATNSLYEYFVSGNGFNPGHGGGYNVVPNGNLSSSAGTSFLGSALASFTSGSNAFSFQVTFIDAAPDKAL